MAVYYVTLKILPVPTLLYRLLFSGLFLCTCVLAQNCLMAQTDVPFSYPSNYISDINDVHVDAAGTGFVGGTCGVLRRTTDNGQTWTVASSPTDNDIEALACPTGGCATALIATDDALYRLSAGNWTEVTYPDYDEGGALHWLTDNLVIHEASSSEIWRSTNGGTTWASVPYGDNKSSDLIFVDATTGYLFANGKLLKTTDGAASFNEVGYTHPNSPFYLAWLDADAGWMFDRDRKFWNTTDGGANWNLLNEDQQLSSMRWFVPLTANHLVAAQGITNAESFDGGVTWTRDQYGVDRVTGIGQKYHRSGTAFFLASSQNQLLYSPANFTDFVDLEDKAIHSRITDIAFATNEVGYAIDGIDLHITTDAGVNWSVNRIGSLMRELGILPNGDPVVLIDQSTVVSHDGGGSFTDLFEAGMVPTSADYPDLMTVKPDGTVYLFASNYSYRSTDDGTTFTREIHNLEMFGTSLFFVDDDYGYVVDRNRKFASTADGGLTWQQGTDVPSSSSEAVFFTSRDTGWVSTVNRRYETTDGGVTWDDPTDDSGGFDFTRRAEDGAIYAARWGDNALVRSTDSGESWTELAGHCFGYRTLALTPNERYAFVAGDGFIVRNDLSVLVTSTRRTDRLAVANLRAYPNPSNRQFWLELPLVNAPSRLSVFDMAGREVKALSVPASRKKLELDLGDLPGGVYVARWSAVDGRSGQVRLVKR